MNDIQYILSLNDILNNYNCIKSISNFHEIILFNYYSLKYLANLTEFVIMLI